MQVISVEEAVGHQLAHDITEIRPGEYKGPAFKRGQIVKKDDIDHLMRLGKDHLYVLTIEPEKMHEDDAATAIADALCGDGVAWEGPPREGKLHLRANRDGLLKVDVEALSNFNQLGEVMCATLHTNTLVNAGNKVASTRAIPLVIERSTVNRAVRIARQCEGVLRVLPLHKATVGVLITGNEVYHGRIEDKFEPIIRNKINALNSEVLEVRFLPDDDEQIASAVLDLIQKGADIIVTTGGMSVDPDDRTRFAFKRAGAETLLYGSAVLPGAMFMTGLLKGVPFLGIPACGLYSATTAFDLIFPRILAGDIITRKEISMLGHGGLCLHCDPCRYPKCPFGKTG